MKVVNFTTVESLIFFDPEVCKVLPPYMSSYIQQWKISKQIPGLRQMGRQALLDLLNGLTDEHIELLEDHFGERVIVEKLTYHITENIRVPLADADEVCQALCGVEGFNYFGTWRDKDYLHISFWR